MKKAIVSFFSVLTAICILISGPCATYSLAASGDRTVYITKTGKCYHESYCSSLKSSIETTLSSAVERGLRPCSKCNPPTLDSTQGSGKTASTTKSGSTTESEKSDTVWISATGSKYHSIDHCGTMNPKKASTMSRADAIARGYTACSKCW